MHCSSIRELCERFWSLEKRHGLNVFEISGVAFWPYIRMSIYYKLGEKMGIIQKPHHVPHNSSVGFRFKQLLSVLFYSIFRNPFFYAKTTDILYFEHERPASVGEAKVDIYTWYSRQQDLRSGKTVASLERHYNMLHPKRDDTNPRIYIDAILLAGGCAKLFYKLFISPTERNEILRVSNILRSELYSDFDYSKELCHAIAKFKVQKFLYKILINMIKPSEINIVVAYGNNDFVSAAQELGIKVTEFQHGIISKYHLGYTYFDDAAIPGYPDVVRLWGENWSLGTVFPKVGCLVIPDLRPPFYDRIRKYRAAVTKSNIVTVISQGAITDKLAKQILEHIDEYSSHLVKIKLHPSEYSRWETSGYLKELSTFSNVEIILDCDLYELMAASIAVVGVFSTALLEARELGCPVFVLPLPGAEYVDGERGFYPYADLPMHLLKKSSNI